MILGVRFVFNIVPFVPFALFLGLARLYGMTEAAWEYAFIGAGIAALCVLLLQPSVISNRFLLGIYLFLWVGALGFITNSALLLSYFETYKGAVFFICITCVGIITTCCSKEGFLVVPGQKIVINKNASLKLLIACMCATMWSIIFYAYNLWISAIAPYIMLVLYRQYLISEMIKEKLRVQ